MCFKTSPYAGKVYSLLTENAASAESFAVRACIYHVSLHALFVRFLYACACDLTVY